MFPKRHLDNLWNLSVSLQGSLTSQRKHLTLTTQFQTQFLPFVELHAIHAIHSHILFTIRSPKSWVLPWIGHIKSPLKANFSEVPGGPPQWDSPRSRRMNHSKHCGSWFCGWAPRCEDKPREDDCRSQIPFGNDQIFDDI